MKMKSIMKKTAITGMIVALALMTFTACGGGDDATGDDAAAGGSVVIAGSTSVQPLSEMLAEQFMSENDGITVEVQGGGSGQGVKAIEEKIADFGALSRGVKEEEESVVGEEHTIAMDGIAVVVNKDTGVDDISMEEIKQIYVGEITNWKDLGGEDEDIVVVSREEGSGTRGAFTELTGVMEKDENGEEIDNTVDTALIQGSTGAVTQTVSSTPFSVGYVSLGSLDESVKALTIDNVVASNENVLNDTYKLSRPFIYISDAEISEAAQAYLDFVMSDDGQAIVEEAGFIPINK